ncbi:ankyrin repeat protein [Grosmannia clavigera kw1407]|uniref:Ankyrin repeat protein n=1 Tax=Grosmannia clavigera (strain kw1407 / UAMH 11150) TaxID=655863 RepID=F0XTT4_GROCL|nr:ankyrin repeat protein [Grosmannia clavigera kw1407]EFW98835.1 ankyrin repeat protein [Grosmannia clavigera kw1407]
MSLYTEAANGALTQSKLQKYLEKHGINEPSEESGRGTNSLTPLALAARNGRVNVVRLLLSPENNARVDGLSTMHRTPLWLVTARGVQRRAEVVQLLLQHKANARYSHPDLMNGSTPLENELRQNRDVAVIQLLVEAGGVTDKARKMAQSLNDPKIDAAMMPRTQFRRIHDKATALIMSLVLFVIRVVNENSIFSRVTNKVSKFFGRFHIWGKDSKSKRVQQIEKEIGQPKTKEEFQQGVADFVKKHQLANFFSKDDSAFLDTLTAHAVDLQNDDSTDLSEPQNASGLIQLSLYQPVIYCDDSTSMNIDYNRCEDRIQEQRGLVHRIAGICTRLVPDDKGIHLRFINTRLPDADNLRMADVERIMADVSGAGATQIGTNLRQQILDPFVYQAHANGSLKRPVFISVITDGVPSNEPSFQLQNEIIQCQEFLLEKGLSPRSVIFQISQIGSDSDSKAFLSGLATDSRLENVCITAQQLDAKFRELRDNERNLEAWLFKTLLAPVLKQE